MKKHIFALYVMFLTRYQQVNDNIMTSFIVNATKIEKEVKEKVKEQIGNDQSDINRKIAKVMLIYVDDSLSDETTFDIPRQKAFAVLPKEEIRTLANKMLNKKTQREDNQWK